MIEIHDDPKVVDVFRRQIQRHEREQIINRLIAAYDGKVPNKVIDAVTNNHAEEA